MTAADPPGGPGRVVERRVVESYVIEPGDPSAADVAALLRRSEQYAYSLYPAQSVHMLPVDELRGPRVRFLVARDAVRGEPLGCGAVVRVGDAYAEIKRMFVEPGARRRGIGLALLTALESWARDAGMPVVRLETGPSQPEAVGLYHRLGYVERDRFGDYPDDDPLSIFMEKPLTGPGGY